MLATFNPLNLNNHQGHYTALNYGGIQTTSEESTSKVKRVFQIVVIAFFAELLLHIASVLYNQSLTAGNILSFFISIAPPLCGYWGAKKRYGGCLLCFCSCNFMFMVLSCLVIVYTWVFIINLKSFCSECRDDLEAELEPPYLDPECYDQEMIGNSTKTSTFVEYCDKDSIEKYELYGWINTAISVPLTLLYFLCFLWGSVLYRNFEKIIRRDDEENADRLQISSLSGPSAIAGGGGAPLPFNINANATAEHQHQQSNMFENNNNEFTIAELPDDTSGTSGDTSGVQLSVLGPRDAQL
jgi:hypothetical protein